VQPLINPTNYNLSESIVKNETSLSQCNKENPRIRELEKFTEDQAKELDAARLKLEIERRNWDHEKVNFKL
jgi:hypothetical protein